MLPHPSVIARQGGCRQTTDSAILPRIWDIGKSVAMVCGRFVSGDAIRLLAWLVRFTCPLGMNAKSAGMFLRGLKANQSPMKPCLPCVLDTYQRLGWDGAVSYIAPENTRSIKLAERLGAFHDKKTTASHDPDCLVYRHPTLKELS